MQSRKSDDLAFLSLHISPEGKPCYWYNHKTTNKRGKSSTTKFLAIPSASALMDTVLQLILGVNRLHVHINEAIPTTAMITKQDAAKLIEIVRRDETLIQDIQHILDHTHTVISQSTYQFDFKAETGKFNYIFKTPQGCEILKGIFAGTAGVLVIDGLRCEMTIAKLLAHSLRDRRTVLTNLKNQLIKYLGITQNAAALALSLPKNANTANYAMKEGVLTLFLHPEYAAAYKPLLVTVKANVGTEGECMISIEELYQQDFREKITRSALLCNQRANRLSRFQDTMNDFAFFRVSCNGVTFSISFLDTRLTPYFMEACSLTKLDTVRENDVFTFDYESIFATSDETITEFHHNLTTVKQKYIAEQKQRLPLTKTSQQQTPEDEAMAAIKINNLPLLQECVAKHKLNVHIAFSEEAHYKMTMVMAATIHGAGDVLSWLLIEKKADFKKPLRSGIHAGLTPIFAAAHMGQLVTLQILIDAGASIDAPLPANCDESDIEHVFAGRRPIFAAVQSGHCDAVHTLIENGADYTTPIQFGGARGTTPLGMAVTHSQEAVVKLLVTKGDADHTAKIGTKSTLEVAKSIADLNKKPGTAAIVEILKEENSAMNACIKTLSANPLLPDEAPYQWARFDGQIVLEIPVAKSRTAAKSYLITFLEAHGIMTESTDETRFLIRKYNAKQLAHIVKNDPKRWADFLNIITLLDKCISISSYICKIQIANLAISFSLPASPDELGLTELLKQDFATKSAEGEYNISLVKLVTAAPKLRASIIESLESYLKNHLATYQAIKNHLDAASKSAFTLDRVDFEDGRANIKLNARAAGIVKPLLTQLEAERSDDRCSFRLTRFKQLTAKQLATTIDIIHTRERRLQALQEFTLRIGARKFTYSETQIHIKFNHNAHLERFKRVTAQTSLGATTNFNYDDILTLSEDSISRLNTLLAEDEANEKHNHLCRTKLATFLKVFGITIEGHEFPATQLVVDVKPDCAAMLAQLGIPGLSIMHDTTTRVCFDMPAFYALTEEKLAGIESDIINADAKLDILHALLRAVKTSAKKSAFLTHGVEIKITDGKLKSLFVEMCQAILIDQQNDDVLVICYTKLLTHDLDVMKTWVTALRATPVESESISAASQASPPTDKSQTYLPFSTLRLVGEEDAPTATKAKFKRNKPARVVEVTPSNNVSPVKRTIANPEIIAKTLNVNPDQSLATVETKSVLRPNSMFSPVTSQNPVTRTEKLLSHLAIHTFALTEIKNHDEFDNIITRDILPCLVELGQLSKAPAVRAAFNRFIYDFLTSNLALLDGTKQAPIAEIYQAAKRGAELWEALMNSECESAHTLLSNSK